VSDEEGAECGEDQPGRAVMDPLAADPDAAPVEVDAQQPITVCPGTPHLSDSSLASIDISRGKSRLRFVGAWLVAVALAASGCGGDDDSASTTPTAPTSTGETGTTPVVTTPTETTEEPHETTPPETTPTNATTGTSPEGAPGGAGDEEPARTLALFTAKDGRIRPRIVRVPPFIAVEVQLRSADGATYALRFGDVTIKAGGQLSSTSTTIDGLRPQEAIRGVPVGRGNAVTISATAEPGP
jgi:hypothetical protein